MGRRFHIDVALDGNQWDGNGENAGGFNIEKLNSMPKISSETQNKTPPPDEVPTEENQKSSSEFFNKIISDLLKEKSEPLFNLNAEDDLTKNIYKNFAEYKKENATGEELSNHHKLFKDLFDSDGNFKDSKENRKIISGTFGDEFKNFGQEQLNNKVAEYKNFLQTKQNSLSAETEKLTSHLQNLTQNYNQYKNGENIDKNFLAQLQNDIFKTADERRQKLNQLTDIQNILKPAEENLPSLQTFQNEISELEKKLSAEKKKLSTALGSKDKSAVKNFTDNIKTLNQQISAKNIELNNFKKSPAYIQTLNTELENLTEMRDNISDVLNSGIQDKNLNQQRENLNNQILNLNRELQNITQSPIYDENQPIKKVGANYVVDGGKNPNPSIAFAEKLGGKYIAKNNNFSFENEQIAKDFLTQRIKFDDLPSGEYNTGIYGANTTVETSSAEEIPVRYKIVPSESLNTSHKFKGGNIYKNEFYPQELQPRNRESKTLQAQVIAMANNLNPRKIGESVYLNEGAPIVREDGTVLNGNARVMAVSEAIHIGKADNYKKYLIDNADKFGFSPEQISSIKNPVLVREVSGNIDADNLNEITKSAEGGADFNPSEQAKSDADSIKISDFEDYNEESGGDLTAKSNRTFVNNILNRVAKTANQQNRFRTADGDLNDLGIKRAQDAVFALAYNDDGLLKKNELSIDDDIKNISKAAQISAVDFAKLKLRERAGLADNYNIGGVVADAIKTYGDIKRDKTFNNVQDYINQNSNALFNPRQNAVFDMLEVFDHFKRNSDTVADFLKDIARYADRKPNPDQTLLDFGDDSSQYRKSRIDEIVRSVRDNYLQSPVDRNLQSQQKENDLPQGYKTQSGRTLNDADSQEFILKPNGSKNFGRIDDEIAYSANKKMEEDNSDFRFKAAPIRLQVGVEDSIDENGIAQDSFGYKHILERIDKIKSRGFKNIPHYIEHILQNYNQIRKSSQEENRIILYCKGDPSKDLMPLDLELEKGNEDFYTIVTAYPRRLANKKDPLILDVRPTNTPADAVSAPHLQNDNNQNGDTARRDIVKRINESSAGNISQSEIERQQAEQLARDKLFEKTESQKIFERGEKRAREIFDNQPEDNLFDETESQQDNKKSHTQSKDDFDSNQEKMHENKPSVYRDGDKFIVHVGNDVSRLKLGLFGTYLKNYNGKYRKGTQTFEFPKASSAVSFAANVEITKMNDVEKQKIIRRCSDRRRIWRIR